MAGGDKGYDPYKEMHDFYSLDDPTEEQQFRFVEAMKYIIDNAWDDSDIRAFSYNLAMYYRDIKDFRLERKYLEMGAKLDGDFSKEELGILCYYGWDGVPDYEKAFKLLNKCDTKRAKYLISDMYRYGYYVKEDLNKCKRILNKLYRETNDERYDERFLISTLFPEIAVRVADLKYSLKEDTEEDLDALLDARDILAFRQSRRPFWGNIKTMKRILEVTDMYVGVEVDFIDLYDLLIFDMKEAEVAFCYEGALYKIDVFQNEGETIYQYNDKWFHGAEGFLEKARIDGKRITTVYNRVSDIKIR